MAGGRRQHRLQTQRPFATVGHSESRLRTRFLSGKGGKMRRRPGGR